MNIDVTFLVSLYLFITGIVVVVRSKAINHLHLAVVLMSTVGLSVYSHLSWEHIWHMTSALTLSASKRSASFLWRQTYRRAAVRAYPMTILRYAASGWADSRIKIGIATGRELRLRPRGWGVRISPGRTSTRGIRHVATSMPILRQQLVARLGEPGWEASLE